MAANWVMLRWGPSMYVAVVLNGGFVPVVADGAGGANVPTADSSYERADATTHTADQE